MNVAKMEKIMEKGYDLNVVSLLYMIKDGPVITQNLKILSILAMMERKGLIIEGRVTATGEELLEYIEEGTEIKKEKDKVMDFEQVYDKVVERVEQLTGKRQVRTDIFGKTYSYLPSKYDFATRLKKVVNKYKLVDIEKLEKVIIYNIEQCHKKNKWYPLLVYYFIKDDVSPLATDYENWENTKDENKEKGLINTKDLF